MPSEQKIEIIAIRLSKATNKGELGIIISEEILNYSVFELQVIGGRLNLEIASLPSPYKKRVKPYFIEQVFGAYHELLRQYRSGTFQHLKNKIHDHDTFISYCQMIPEGCKAWDETTWKNPEIWNPRHRLFYYLIAAFTMFIMDKPGHPVGTPFPGGLTVEKKGNEYLCPIRDKEKDVFFSICNYCPAKQSGE